jgi:serine protease
VPPLADGATRTVSAVRAPDGGQAEFVDRELLYEVHADTELATALTRWNGTIVREISPPRIAPSAPKTVVVRIDSTRSQPDALLARLLEIDNRPLGAHRLSSSLGLATVAAAAEEVLAGRHVALNWLSHADSTALSLPDWVARHIADGAWVPAGADTDHPLTPNAFSWPGFASCNPDLTTPELPHPCTSALADGSPIFQQLTVADAWRALALSGRMLQGSVPVALVDAGFAASHPDYPPSNMGGSESDIHEQSEAGHFAHGTNVMLAGYALAGNGFGAAGPGGPVANVAIEAVPVTNDGVIAGFSDAPFTSRVLSTSIGGEIPAVLTVFHSMSDLTQEIRNGGMLELAAAGNDGVDVDAESCFIACWETRHYWPCEDDGVDCVTGMGFNLNTKDPGSNWGSDTNTIAGPYETAVSNVPLNLVNGVVQAGSLPDGSFDSTFEVGFSGTSGAAPFVAGIASLLVAADSLQSTDREEHCLYEPSHLVSDGFSTRQPDALASVRCIETGNSFGDLPTFLQIDSPTDGATFDVGELVTVEATATDYEAGLLPVNWSSDVDGMLTISGSGALGNVIFNTPGTRHLTASAVGSDGVVVSQTITVTVGNTAPDIAISEPPADGEHFPEGFDVTLSAELLQFASVPVCSAFTWASTSGTGSLDFDGLTGCTIQPAFTVLGSHSIVVAYTDPVSGLKSVANREIEVDATNGFLARIITPPNVSGQQAEDDQVLALAAQSNGTNVVYQWSVTVGSTTITLPGTLATNSWDPTSIVTPTCDGVMATINMSATNGADGTASQDSEQIFLAPSTDFISANCVL